ncbi:MAG TPA: flavodoxin [Aggregatilineales bacterium]|nr:flavodoxin [Aggregatilineales bacterium]
MAKIGLFYGSSTGNTEFIAYQIKEEFDKVLPGEVEVHNIGSTTAEKVLSYPYLIMGTPTWNTGELQDDWAVFWPNFDSMDFKGKKVALFGVGDQNGYGYNFLDALGMLADQVLLHNGELFGMWSNKTYEYEESKADIEDHLLGLGIDQDGQEGMTGDRIKQWVVQVKEQFGL